MNVSIVVAPTFANFLSLPPQGWSARQVKRTPLKMYIRVFRAVHLGSVGTGNGEKRLYVRLKKEANFTAPK